METAAATETQNFEFVTVKEENMEDLEANEQDPLQDSGFSSVKREKFEDAEVDGPKVGQVSQCPMMKRELLEDNTGSGGLRAAEESGFAAVKREEFEDAEVDDLKQSQVRHGSRTSCGTSAEVEDSPNPSTGLSDANHYELEPCRNSAGGDCEGPRRGCPGGQGDVTSQLYTCSLCLKLFSSKYSLINHVFTHLEGIQPPPHICRLCGEVFHSAAHLSEHSVLRRRCSAPVSMQSSSGSELAALEPDKFKDAEVDGQTLEQVWHGSCTSSGTSTQVEDLPSSRMGYTDTDHCKLKPCRSSLSEHCKGLWKGCASGQGDIASQFYTCSLCLNLFSSKYSLINHVFTHMEGIQPPSHICRLCGEVFHSAVQLTEHSMQRKWHSTAARMWLSSVITGESSTLPLKVTGSKLLDSAEKASCEVCGKMLTLVKHLNKHKKIHTAEKLYSCKFCSKSFSCSQSLKYHISTHTQERPHTCEMCGKSFSRRNTLKEHIRTHTQERPHTCKMCGKSFIRSAHLKHHIRTHTQERPHSCEMCGKSFSQSGTLKHHIRTHTQEKPHTCAMCGKSFIRSVHLKHHIYTHTHERPHTCEMCGKSFIQSAHLKHHIRTHTQERPHTCEMCGKSFSQSGHLKCHIRTHTQERPHTCEMCGKSFIRSDHLKHHIRTHTQERPHTCAMCGKSFIQSGNLKRHIHTHT